MPPTAIHPLTEHGLPQAPPASQNSLTVLAPDYGIAVPPVTQPADRSFAAGWKRKRIITVAATALGTAIVLFAAAFIAFHGYVAWVLTHPYVAPLASNPLEAKGLAYSEATFPSRSGKTAVDAWYIPAAAPSSQTIVFSHGYGANREEDWVPMYDLTEFAHSLHYNVVLFDYGYASPSDRQAATGGREESQQLLAAVDFARGQGANKVIVWGFSMGAGTALQAALYADSSIDAMLLDSLFIAEPDTIFQNVSRSLPLPRYPSLNLISAFFPWFTGTSLSSIPAEEVKTTAFPMPILFMHGTADEMAPPEIARTIASQQANPLSSLWVAEGAIHEMLFRTYTEDYIYQTSEFLRQIGN